MRPIPGRRRGSLHLSYSTRQDTASNVGPTTPDYPALSWQTTIDSSVYAYTRDADSDPFVARMPLSDRNGFKVLDDDIYEGPERFGLIIEGGRRLPRSGIVQLRMLPDGTTCALLVQLSERTAQILGEHHRRG